GRNSADLAVRLRNADPKAKYRYELVSLDDECKPNIAVQAATKAASDNSIVAGVTHYCSVAAIAAVDTYHKFGFPAVVWGAVLPDITYRNNYAEVHRVNGTMINQNDVAAKFMTGLKYKRWVIIHDTTDYGKGHDKYFTEYLTKYGGQVLGRFGVTADQQDFTAELTKAKELKPEVIYFGGLTPIGVRIRSQMERLGIDAVFEGTSGIKSDSYIDGLGKLAEGSLSFIEGAPWEKLPGGLYFIGKYAQQKYDQGPEAYGPFAFTAAGLIMDVIEQVVANGLMLGVIYAMVAVGFTLFFGVLDVIKFSHGDVLTAGAFAGLATYGGLQALGFASPAVQLLIILLVAVAAMAFLGALIAKY